MAPIARSLPRAVRYAAALIPTLAAVGAAQQRHTLRGADVAVYNLAGRISVEAGAGPDVVVEVTPRGRDAGRLTVDAGSLDGRSSLRVRYPDDRIVYRGEGQDGGSRTSVRVDDEGRFGHGNGGRRVEITPSGSGLDASADVRVRVPAGKRVALYLAVGEASVTNVASDLRVNVSAARVTTSGTRGRLELDTGSGGVQVSDHEGDLAVDAGSGGIRLERVRGATLTFDTGSGGIAGSDITATRVGFDTGSGGVRLRALRASDIRVDAGSGSVELGLLGDVENLEVDTGSGGVTIAVPSTLGAELSIDVGSGGIESEIPLDVMRRSRRELSGRIGDGKGRIQIETGSGGVRLTKAG